MSIAALELNDQSLLIQAEDGALHAETGFARLTDDGVVTGEEARAVAWREPQHVYNQYWCQLNQAPLPVRHRYARHHADIAFAQLQSLWQNAGSPDSLLLLVPGSFTGPQLSLLLGMAAALPCRVEGVIDSALAACGRADGDTLHLDLQMHDAVLTVCRPRGDRLRIVEQQVFPGLGMAQIHNSLARYVSDSLIASYRFDPLHSSETEQAIFDQVPHWMMKLCWETAVPVKITTPGGEHPCVLDRETIRAQLGERLSGLRAFLAKWKNCTPLVSHASGLVRGLVEDLADAEALEQTEATQWCLVHQESLKSGHDGLAKIREIERDDPDAADAALPGGRPATHLLHGNLALPLRQPVGIRIGPDGPVLSSEYDEQSALVVVLRKNSLEVLQRDCEATLPEHGGPGGTIRIGGHELRLIRVRGD